MTALAILSWLRWAGIVAWIIVLIRLARPMLRAFGAAPYAFDPLWATIWLMVLNRLAYQGSSLVFVNTPNTVTEVAWRIFLQVWSIAMAIGVLLLKGWFKAHHHA